jgi:hypothetical protein
MSQARPARPPILLSACVYLGLICALQLARVVAVMSEWNSFAGQARLKRYTQAFVDGGMSRADAETAFRVVLAVLAFVAATGVILAVYTALGHRVSRVLLTIVGVVIALACLSAGSLIYLLQGVIALAFVFQLWTPDVRTWFAVKNGAVPQPAAAGAWPPPMPPVPQGPGVPGDQAPHPQAYAPSAGPRPPAGQDTARTIAIITLIGSSLIAFGSAVYLLMYAFARDALLRQQLDSNAKLFHQSEAEIVDGMRALAILCGVGLPLSLVAVAASVVLLVRRRPGP